MIRDLKGFGFNKKPNPNTTLWRQDSRLGRTRKKISVLVVAEMLWAPQGEKYSGLNLSALVGWQQCFISTEQGMCHLKKWAIAAIFSYKKSIPVLSIHRAYTATLFSLHLCRVQSHSGSLLSTLKSVLYPLPLEPALWYPGANTINSWDNGLDSLQPLSRTIFRGAVSLENCDIFLEPCFFLL